MSLHWFGIKAICLECDFQQKKTSGRLIIPEKIMLTLLNSFLPFSSPFSFYDSIVRLFNILIIKTKHVSAFKGK